MGQQRIAILGGGVASLAAAWELTRTPELRAQHDVTVYQMGWRLGGKGATGRNLEPGKGLRIEEHGLHIWLGFYDNAFALIQDAYAELVAEGLAPDSPIRTWQQAFTPQSFTPVGLGDGVTWLPVTWPTNSKTPGAEGPPHPLHAIAATLELLGKAVFATWGRHPLRWACVLWRMWRIRAAAGKLATDAVEGNAEHLKTIHDHVEAMAAEFRKVGDKPGDGWILARLVLDLIEIGLACLRGFLNPKYGLLKDFDLDRIDGYEFLAWLVENGAPAHIGALRVTENLAAPRQPFLRALYDLAFAYRQADVGGAKKMTADFAAGAALRCCIRICAGYKGAVLYEMLAGMGEVAVAPLYLVLKARGVKFEFFSKVEALHLSDNRNWIERIAIREQAQPADGKGAYDPLFAVGGLPCWPNTPFWDQLADGEALAAAKTNFESHWLQVPAGYAMPLRELKLGEDFDQVVLGISIGAFKDFANGEVSPCAELIAASPQFAAMTAVVGIVPTHAEQLWLNRDLPALGWTDARPAMVGSVEPFDVWADMTRSIPREGWAGTPPASLHYFCGPLNTDAYTKPASDFAVPANALGGVHERTRDWLERYTGSIWPKAAHPDGGIDWSVLYGGEGEGAARLGWQFLRANIDPTECCPATWSGTTQYRLRAEGAGFMNLTLAGDWTRTGTNTACVESAVMSGMAASRAICGEPKYIPGEHFMQSEAPR